MLGASAAGQKVAAAGDTGTTATPAAAPRVRLLPPAPRQQAKKAEKKMCPQIQILCPQMCPQIKPDAPTLSRTLPHLDPAATE